MKFKFAPYSHSKISCYESCPKAFEFKYINKIKITIDPRFFEKGRFYHKVLECYPEPIDFKFKYTNEKQIEKYKENINKFIESGSIKDCLLNKFGTELEFKFDSKLNSTDVTKWKSALYGYIDYVGKEDDSIVVIDWKSKDHGDRFPCNEKQLQMYAAWVFTIRPNLKKLTCKFSFIENCTEQSFEYTRKDGEAFKDDILQRIDLIENDLKFEKKIKKECKGCDYFNLCEPFKVRTKK